MFNRSDVGVQFSATALFSLNRCDCSTYAAKVFNLVRYIQKVKIGIWGRRHEQYIKQYHKLRYFNLLTSCKLIDYLADIDREAAEMYDYLVNQFAKQEGITEQLKYDNPMLWVKYMNNIRNRATEFVLSKLIYN